MVSFLKIKKFEKYFLLEYFINFELPIEIISIINEKIIDILYNIYEKNKAKRKNINYL